MACRFAVALFALVTLLLAPARAQQLQRLHVRNVTLSASTDHPSLNVPFTVVLTITVRENTHLQNVFLPYFAGPEELGDIREERHAPGRTTYRETLSLVAHRPGLLRIGPAYVDAVDANDGQPKRFSSNVLVFTLPGPQSRAPSSGGWLFVALLLAGAAGSVFALRARQRPSRDPQPAAATASPPEYSLGSALAQLRLRRDRSAVFHVRTTLWHLAGAGAGSTLSDVLQLPTSVDEHVRSLLLRVEEACFVADADLPGAVEALLCEGEVTFV